MYHTREEEIDMAKQLANTTGICWVVYNGPKGWSCTETPTDTWFRNEWSKVLVKPHPLRVNRSREERFARWRDLRKWTYESVVTADEDQIVNLERSVT